MPQITFGRIGKLCVFSLALFTAVSNAHVGSVDRDHQIDTRSASDVLDDRDAESNFKYGYVDQNGTSTELLKRTLFNLDGNSEDDTTILNQAFLDMQALVTYVAQNPNAQVLARYFDPNDNNDVNAIFNTVMQMASPNPPAQIPGTPQYTPMDLHEISVIRPHEGYLPTLAESFRTSFVNFNLQIKVYEFGWNSLFARLRQDIQCSDIGPNTNYKMHFLGSLLLHEVLHFNNVPLQAWGGTPDPAQCLDDQDGQFPCTSKAYGPYEAMKLLADDAPGARLNIENYVWYALETYWLNQCPGRATGGMFTAARNNDIPTVCKKLAGGVFDALSNLWCFRS